MFYLRLNSCIRNNLLTLKQLYTKLFTLKQPNIKNKHIYMHIKYIYVNIPKSHRDSERTCHSQQLCSTDNNSFTLHALQRDFGSWSDTAAVLKMQTCFLIQKCPSSSFLRRMTRDSVTPNFSIIVPA